MKCKVFKLHPQSDSDESKLNKFLEGVEVKHIFAQIVEADEHFWSVLAFYEDAAQPKSAKQIVAPPAQVSSASAPDKTRQPEKLAPDSIVLTPRQEEIFNDLKKWRNETAQRDGIPPYMIAHNLSLVQIAASPVDSKEDLIAIKGFGEKRAEKYGDEILRILGVSSDESESEN